MDQNVTEIEAPPAVPPDPGRSLNGGGAAPARRGGGARGADHEPAAARPMGLDHRHRARARAPGRRDHRRLRPVAPERCAQRDHRPARSCANRVPAAAAPRSSPSRTACAASRSTACTRASRPTTARARTPGGHAPTQGAGCGPARADGQVAAIGTAMESWRAEFAGPGIARIRREGPSPTPGDRATRSAASFAQRDGALGALNADIAARRADAKERLDDVVAVDDRVVLRRRRRAGGWRSSPSRSP